MIHRLKIETSQRCEFIDITSRIEKVVGESGVSDGICSIHVPHTTAGLTINENADPAVRHDILRTLDRLVPEDSKYTHSEGNADAHVKSSIIGNEKTVLIENGRISLGTWQGLFFCEFDGPRQRRISIKIITAS